MEGKPYTLCVRLERPRKTARFPTRASANPALAKKKTNLLSRVFRSTTSVPYETEADAEAVRATLAVDNELQPDKVVKKLKVEGKNLVAYVSRSRPALRRAPTSDRAIFFPRSTVRDLTLASPRLTRVASHRSEFFATEPRLLRAAVAAFLDLLNLSTRTIEEFGHVPAQVA